MARLYLDHNVARGTATALRERGHDAITASERQQARASDAALLLTATQEGRVVVTHDVDDYLLLHDAWRRWFIAYATVPAPPHAGILVIPAPDYQRQFWLPGAAAREVDAFLARGFSLAGQLHRWTVSRGWRQY